MITIEQAKSGLMRYIDNDMLPHLSGLKHVGLGIYSALAAENASRFVMQYMSHPAIAILGVMDENGNIDLDKLYSAASKMFANGERVTINIPVIGEYTVDRSDLEKLYRYMRG